MALDLAVSDNCSDYRVYTGDVLELFAYLQSEGLHYYVNGATIEVITDDRSLFIWIGTVH